MTTPDPFQARAVVDQARKANPSIDSVVRTHSEEERAYLARAGVGLAVMGELELARAMARYALSVSGAEPANSTDARPEGSSTVPG